MTDRVTARRWKDEAKGYFISHGRIFQLVAALAVDEESLIKAFVRVQNKLQKPKPLHYPIPALADHRIRWQNAFMIPEPLKATAY